MPCGIEGRWESTRSSSRCNPSRRATAMAEQSDKWLAYVRAVCIRYQIDPAPILGGLP